MKKCPYCAEEIQDEAIKCKHCGELLDDTKKLRNEGIKKEEALDKIEEGGGCGTVLISLIIPGSGQIVKGQVGKGILFFVLAVGLGVISYGILAVVIAIISVADASSSIYKCPKCREIVQDEATVCKHCGTKFKENKQ